MEKADTALLYGISVLLFAAFSLLFDVLYPTWGENFGLLGMLICTIAIAAKFAGDVPASEA